MRQPYDCWCQFTSLLCIFAGGLAIRVQLPFTPAVGEGTVPADPAAKAQEMRARGKALVARRRQKQLEEKEGQLTALMLVQEQVC